MDLTPPSLMRTILSPIENHPIDQTTSQLLEAVRLSDYIDRQYLEEFFKHLAKKNRRLVILLDEFDTLLPYPNPHPAFKDFSFFAVFRALDAYPSFSYVTTSRKPVKTLNERAHSLPGSGGSPVFNTQVEWRLKPFDDEFVGLLIGKGNAKFSLDDKVFIHRLAGSNPFLTQLLSDMLWQFDRQEAVERFYDAAAQHFDDLWNNLDNNTRTTAVILCLAELNGIAQGRDFAFGEIEQSERFGPELNRLRELGLAECVQEKSNNWCNWIFEYDKLLVWRGERWAISSKIFAWWVRDVVISETRSLPTYQEWLSNKEHAWLLTKEQWNLLSEGIKHAPDVVSGSIRILADAVWSAIKQRKA